MHPVSAHTGFGLRFDAMKKIVKGYMLLDEFMKDHCERWVYANLPTSEWGIEKRLIKFLRDHPEWLEREFTWWQVYDAMREPIATDWQDLSKGYEAV